MPLSLFQPGHDLGTDLTKLTSKTLFYFAARSGIMLPLRSSARLAAQASPSAALGTNASRAVEMKTPTRKRKPETTLTKENVKKVPRETTVPFVGQPDNSVAYEDEDVPAVLTFDFELAKKHLIAVDHRFEDIFDKMRCKPFEQLERVHPFRYERSNCYNFQGLFSGNSRALATSIL